MTKDPVSDLSSRLAVLNARFDIAFDRYPQAPDWHATAEIIVAKLKEYDPKTVTRVRAIVDPEEMFTSTFWGSPLGQLLFLAGGFEDKAMGQGFAAGILHLTRQRISQLVKGGKLTQCPGAMVRTEEVRRLLASRIDKPVK